MPKNDGTTLSPRCLSAVVALSAAAVLPAALLAAAAPPASAASHAGASTSAASTTATIQALLDKPVDGTVNLPTGTYTIQPTLRLSRGEKIVGHHTTLKVASGAGNYRAILTGTSASTKLSGLTITGVTFDQNHAGNPITRPATLYSGSPRMVLLITRGSSITIKDDTFINTDNVNTVATGGATSDVTITGNRFRTVDSPMHDHSSIYTSGTGTTIARNTFSGQAAYACAIEVHGHGAHISGNTVTGYYKAANIVSSDTAFTGNTVKSAANPVDLWSTVSPGLHNVSVTGNVLNRDLTYWTGVLRQLGRVMPAARYTQQVSYDPASTYPFSHITTSGNNR